MARPFRFRSSVVSGPAASLPLGYYGIASEFFRRSTASTNDSIYPPPLNHEQDEPECPKDCHWVYDFPYNHLLCILTLRAGPGFASLLIRLRPLRNRGGIRT